MKREDFMPYTGRGPLPYRLNILGWVAPDATIPEGPSNPGDAWIIQPGPDARPCWSFLVFWDGTQFRVPRTPWADVGSNREGKVMYCIENSVSSMFLPYTGD